MSRPVAHLANLDLNLLVALRELLRDDQRRLVTVIAIEHRSDIHRPRPL